MNHLLVQKVVDFKGSLFRWGGKATNDALPHSGHQNLVAKLLPTFLGVVNDHDGPATLRLASRVKNLSLWWNVSAGMHRCDGRLVLRLVTVVFFLEEVSAGVDRRRALSFT